MLLFAILYLMFAFNLITVITEKTTIYYKDLRFWLIILSLIVLVFLTVESYPLAY